jgi:hypothetical protein
MVTAGLLATVLTSTWIHNFATERGKAARALYRHQTPTEDQDNCCRHDCSSEHYFTVRAVQYERNLQLMEKMLRLLPTVEGGTTKPQDRRHIISTYVL